MSSPIEQLAQSGQAYVDRVSAFGGEIEYPFYKVVEYNVGGTRNDGTALETATELAKYEGSPGDAKWLDEPLFSWNKSYDFPQFAKQKNPIINATECSPTALVNLATNIITGDLPAVPEVKARIIERIGAVFFAGATPRQLMDDFRGEVGFMLKDAEHPEIHAAGTTTFFGAIAAKTMVSFDIHDIAHHAVQLQTWPGFYSEVGRYTHDAFATQDQEASKAARHLSGLVMDVTFEESLVNSGGQLHSFGCLNWLSPRDTPAAAAGITDRPPDAIQRLNQKWHALYAIKDMYRTQKKASKALGRPLDWVKQLGYETDDKFRALCERPIDAPLLELDINDVNHIEVHAPRSPEELFANALGLVRAMAIYE